MCSICPTRTNKIRAWDITAYLFLFFVVAANPLSHPFIMEGTSIRRSFWGHLRFIWGTYGLCILPARGIPLDNLGGKTAIVSRLIVVTELLISPWWLSPTIFFTRCIRYGSKVYCFCCDILAKIRFMLVPVPLVLGVCAYVLMYVFTSIQESARL
jgi:hypothetical protein